MKPNIGITPQNLKKVTEILSAILADGMVLYIKTRKFHWNVAGESFMEYHKLFESHYKKLEEAIDEVAERISKFGSMAIGTTKEFSDLSQLKESPGKNARQVWNALPPCNSKHVGGVLFRHQFKEISNIHIQPLYVSLIQPRSAITIALALPSVQKYL